MAVRSCTVLNAFSVFVKDIAGQVYFIVPIHAGTALVKPRLLNHCRPPQGPAGGQSNGSKAFVSVAVENFAHPRAVAYKQAPHKFSLRWDRPVLRRSAVCIALPILKGNSLCRGFDNGMRFTIA